MKQFAILTLFSVYLFSACTPAPEVKEQLAPLSPRFNHVVIYVADMEESVKFYTTAFDLEQTDHLTSLSYTDADGNTLEREINIVLLKFPGQQFVYEMVEQPEGFETTNAGALYQ